MEYFTNAADAIADKSKGAKVYLTSYPDTHRHCEIIASKQSDITRPKVCFE